MDPLERALEIVRCFPMIDRDIAEDGLAVKIAAAIIEDRREVLETVGAKTDYQEGQATVSSEERAEKIVANFTAAIFPISLAEVDMVPGFSWLGYDILESLELTIEQEISDAIQEDRKMLLGKFAERISDALFEGLE